MALIHTLSFQVYSARKFPPVADQLKTVAGLGYTNVEPFGGLYEDLDGLKAAVDAAGVSVYSGHFSLDMMEHNFDRAVTIAKTLGIKLIIVPHIVADLRPSDAAGWQALGHRLGAIAQKLGPLGFDFAWHNHDFEFKALADGSFPIEHILVDPAVKLELDVAWVARAGQDPKPWIAKYASRIEAFHLKDIAPAGECLDEDGWADVGHGVIDWADLWPVLIAAGAKVGIAEHDNPSDYVRFAARTAAAVATFS